MKNPRISIRATQWLIRLYQHTLSPDHGPLKVFFAAGACRHTPTCSQYAHEALQQNGWLGILQIITRIIRCNPYSRGGYDPIKK